MKRSTERILTTHVGSLPRPDDLVGTLKTQLAGQPIDQRALQERLPSAVAEIVAQQAEIGLDVVDDGEVGKPHFVSYIEQRLTGFESREISPEEAAQAYYLAGSREFRAFPEYYQPEQTTQRAVGSLQPRETVCVGPVSYRGHDQLHRDIANLQTATRDVAIQETFFPAVSPNQVTYKRRNEYYRTDEEYEIAVADALRDEYRAIVAAGCLVQVDDPQLLTQWTRDPDLSVADWRRWAEHHVEVLNYALRDIPPDRIRFHTCYSISAGPRVYDMELKNSVDVILKLNVGAISFEAANSRHEHEWKLWETVKLPDHVVLIPGMVTPSNVMVEHPETVAQRIERFARVVGKENLIAGVDCGFSSTANSLEMHPRIVWAKLASLVEGARLASERLWPG
jgi:5-methyltetrahydropteroyltriglutamate--homocysteine methyltransferase